MNLNPVQFLALEEEFTSFETSAVAILPVPYEGGVSYGKGTASAPEAVIEASQYLELYDEVLKGEPYRMGITTLAPLTMSGDQNEMVQTVHRNVKTVLEKGKFVVVIGGDHSISSPHFVALHEKFGELSAIQVDAHADLRDAFQGSKLSHGSVMARIREHTEHTLQIGIRSLSLEEAMRIERENLAVCTMYDFRRSFDLESALQRLPDPVFLTFDVDVLDWSVIMSTGTPEPGGFLWDEALHMLEMIFAAKNVIGFDVVELLYREGDRNSPFAVAKLIYKMLGFWLKSKIRASGSGWPEKPAQNPSVGSNLPRPASP